MTTGNHRIRRCAAGALLAASALTLAACGDSGDGGSTGSSDAAENSTTVAGFVSFLESLASDDNSEPVALSDSAAPVDDTGDPKTF